MSPDLSLSSMAAPEALGQSEAFIDFQERLSLVAPIERPVLILGERGTGKELAATRLHFLSGRWQGPFVTLNCASLSPSLVESELFGHERGAFTGAHQRRRGRFLSADKGTLFLDEMASIPMEVQEKILRVVEYGTFEPVGSGKPIEVDVRIISATNVDLSIMAEEGTFKRDLLDRLSFEVLFLPPLRNRKGDIMLLANHFARRMAYELGRETLPVFAPHAEKALNTYSWEGNVRELKNVVERAVYKSRTHIVDEIIFNPFISPYGENDLLNNSVVKSDSEKKMDVSPFVEPSKAQLHETVSDVFEGIPMKKAMEILERTMIKTALEKSNYNQKKAASLLALSYDQFRGVFRKHKDVM